MGMQRYNSTILALVADGGGWSASHPGHFTLGETTPCSHCIEAWVGLGAPTVIMGEWKNLLLLQGIKPRLLSCSA
jgi:hypothetical protein